VTLLELEPLNSTTDFGFVTPLDEGGSTPTPCDFVTSGGFVMDDAGKKVSFGIHGGCKNGEFWGHVNILEHATGYHINGEEITGYLVPDGAPANTREICGLATTNRSEPQPVKFRIRLIDNGEPGSADLFGVRLSSGYHVSTRLLSALKPGGGNIELHDPNPSTIAPITPSSCGDLAPPD
jgi:hypothetical protein